MATFTLVGLILVSLCVQISNGFVGYVARDVYAYFVLAIRWPINLPHTGALTLLFVGLHRSRSDWRLAFADHSLQV